MRSTLFFIGGIAIGTLGTVCLMGKDKKEYMTREEVLELTSELEQFTIETVLETLDLLDEEAARKQPHRGTDGYN